ncbi:MAG TPA: prephenate dehydratase, partial [Rhodobacter sp.]|nr:prephenate dehydratase [Rhodobacter sp.]
ENNEVDFGMIPFENSYAGRVAEIHNLLQDYHISIVSEHFCAIRHHLAAPKGTKITDITDVYSHPQALMQCRKSLINLGIQTNNSSNTAHAAQMVGQENDKSKAALCSKLAAQINGLEIIQKDLQDDKENNFTVFLVISKKASDPNEDEGKVITALLFTIRNIPASLYKALGGFATNNVNILKLESYIPGGVSRQAKFFISIEGHPQNRDVSLALEELGFFSKKVKVLGIYHADAKRFEE